MEVDKLQEWLNLWYWSMKYEDKRKAEAHKSKIDSALEAFTEPRLRKWYQLLTARYHLANKDLAAAASVLAETEPIDEEEPSPLGYYYFFFRGIYHYDQGHYRTAIEMYLRALPAAEKMAKIEKAEFYYKLATAYHRTYQIALSAEFLKKALKIFKQHSFYQRAAHCENVLGLNYHDTKQFKEAQYHYHNALIYAEKAADQYVKMLTLHNFGLLHSDQNEPKAAINHLLQARSLIDSRDQRLNAQNLYLLAKNYFRNGQTANAREMINRGLEASEEMKDKEFYYRCSLLKAKFVEPAFFEKTYREGIAFYFDRELWERVIEYSEELAIYYQGTELFEEACRYYDLAIIARNKIEERRALSYD